MRLVAGFIDGVGDKETALAWMREMHKAGFEDKETA
jgi:hypothetical protein